MSSQQIEWDQRLIEKYNYAGPRYTSYPTALEFSESFDSSDFQRAVARYPERPLSLYCTYPVLSSPLLFLWLQQNRDASAA